AKSRLEVGITVEAMVVEVGDEECDIEVGEAEKPDQIEHGDLKTLDREWENEHAVREWRFYLTTHCPWRFLRGDSTMGRGRSLPLFHGWEVSSLLSMVAW
ncbi:hypothetical protein U1Q18_047382, partial [Sarracenia purpurea var. burkii]